MPKSSRLTTSLVVLTLLALGCRGPSTPTHKQKDMLLREWSAPRHFTSTQCPQLDLIKLPIDAALDPDLSSAEAAFVRSIDEFLFHQIKPSMTSTNVERLLGPPFIQLNDIAFYRRGINGSAMVAPRRFAGIIVRYSRSGNVESKCYGGELRSFSSDPRAGRITSPTNSQLSLEKEIELAREIDRKLIGAVRTGMSRVSVESILGAPVAYNRTEGYYRRPPTILTPSAVYSINAFRIHFSELGMVVRKESYY